jgi:hypothetical protein
MNNDTNTDGKQINLGDWVEFKCDIEQCGRVIAINGTELTLRNEEGFSGDYIGGDFDCTIDATEVF